MCGGAAGCADPSVGIPSSAMTRVVNGLTITEPIRCRRTGPTRRSVCLAIGVAVIVSAVGLFLRAQLPFFMPRSVIDDYHFVRQAAFLNSHHWLGRYDLLTLSKGPAYPAFIAVSYRLHLDLKLAEQLTTLAAAAMIAAGVWLVTRRLWLTTIVYVVMALNPISFTVGSAGVLRDGWYAPLCILFPATVFAAVYGAINRRVRWGWWAAVSVFGGVTGAAMWLCREEGSASIPPVVILVLVLPLAALIRKIRRTPKRRRRWWRETARGWRAIVAVAGICVTMSAILLSLSAENQHHYGVGLTNDTSDGAFLTAYSDWTRVQAGRPMANRPILKAQREAVYAVSPAARELSPYLEDWNHCSQMHTSCEIPGTFLVWAIRDAADRAGHFRSAPDTQAFFGKLDAQILAGCSSGAFTCSTKLPAALQPLEQTTVSNLLRVSVAMFKENLMSRNLVIPPPQGPVPTAARADFAAVARDTPATQAMNVAQNADAVRWHWAFSVFFWIYRLLIPLLFVAGLAGFLVGLVRPRWPRAALTGLSGSMLVGMIIRIGVLALVHLTQFDAEIARYQVTTQMFMVTMGVVGAASLVDQLAQRNCSQPARDSGSKARARGRLQTSS